MKISKLILSTIFVLGTIFVGNNLISSISSYADENVKNESILNITRLEAGNRFTTSTLLNKEIFKSAKSAVLVNGRDYKSSILAGTIASEIKSPIYLIENSDYVNSDVINQLKAKGVKKLYIMVHNNDITSTTIKKYKSNFTDVELIDGKNYNDIENKVSLIREKLINKGLIGIDGKDFRDRNPIAIVNGNEFSDALTASTFVGQIAYKDKPVDLKLMNTNKDSFKSPLFVFGGENSVSSSIDGYRLAGKNRFETAINVAKYYKKISKSKIDTAFIVSGYKFPDAMAVSGACSSKNAVVLLTDKDNINYSTKKFIEDNHIENVYIVGGEDSVSYNIEKQLLGEDYKNNEIKKMTDSNKMSYDLNNIIKISLNKELYNNKNLYVTNFTKDEVFKYNDVNAKDKVSLASYVQSFSSVNFNLSEYMYDRYYVKASNGKLSSAVLYKLKGKEEFNKQRLDTLFGINDNEQKYSSNYYYIKSKKDNKLYLLVCRYFEPNKKGDYLTNWNKIYSLLGGENNFSKNFYNISLIGTDYTLTEVK